MIRLRCRWPFERWSCSCCGALVEGAAPSSVLRGLCCDPCLDKGWTGEPYVPLTVRPVGPVVKQEQRPIVAVSMREQACVSEAGETFDLEGLVDRVRERKQGERGRPGPLRPNIPQRLEPSIVVTDHATNLLGYLDNSVCSSSPLWNWQVSIRGGTAWRPEARYDRARTFLIPKPVRFGYASQRGRHRRAKGKALWYLLLDPHAFCELPDGWGDLDALELLRFGLELRQWCNTNRLPLLAGVSSYGTRLLKDSRFADGWRRKIPAATNRRIRRRLPGNHYQLLGRPGMRHDQAHKWDQASAHHHAALTGRFPHADLLEVRGKFRCEPPRSGESYETRGAIRAGTAMHHDLLKHPGLFVIAVSTPERVAIDPLQVPALRRAGVTWQTMTSVEIAHAQTLADDGVELLDIHTCWTSPEADERLQEYAWWSMEQLEAHRGRRELRWLKPLLLATYGMLAARPGRFRNGWHWCHKPDGAIGWQTPHGQLVGLERSTRSEREPMTANVLWRAIIESSVRLRSLEFARELRAGGMRPLAIYADAVFATGHYDREHTLTPPWRYEGTVSKLIFESPSRYRSREETRLPGSPRRGRMADPFTGRTNPNP